MVARVQRVYRRTSKIGGNGGGVQIRAPGQAVAVA